MGKGRHVGLPLQVMKVVKVVSKTLRVDRGLLPTIPFPKALHPIFN